MLSEKYIRLRPLHEDDTTMLAHLANNREVWINLRNIFPHPYSENDAANFIALTKTENPQTTFAIEYRDEFCGVIGLTPQPDVYRKTAEIGYWIGEPFWNKGVASIAVKLITNYAFEQLDFLRIHTGIFDYNLASMRVLEKNGYHKEGIFKNSIYKAGKICDEHRYAKLKFEV